MENPNIIRLLEMLESPEAYSEQEISSIINCDDDTREVYRLMAAARQGYAHRQAEQAADAEAAWNNFRKKAHFSLFTLHSLLKKTAALFIGLLLMSGIAFAAIRLVRQSQQPQAGQTASVTAAESTHIAHHPSLPADTIVVQPIVYDNIPLGEMLPEIAAHYGAEVVFQSDEARQLRFHFVWNPQQEIAKVIDNLNHFEHLHVALKDKQVIVEQ